MFSISTAYDSESTRVIVILIASVIVTINGTHTRTRIPSIQIATNDGAVVLTFVLAMPSEHTDSIRLG